MTDLYLGRLRTSHTHMLVRAAQAHDAAQNSAQADAIDALIYRLAQDARLAAWPFAKKPTDPARTAPAAAAPDPAAGPAPRPYRTFDELDGDQAYDMFSKSYTESTGKAWDRDKFDQRSQSYHFYGDDNGFVSARPQGRDADMYKLTGVAGNPRSIMKGLDSLLGTGKPAWSMVTGPIKEMAVRKGFISPPPMMMKLIFKLIPKSSLGGAVVQGFNDDGSVNMSYSDVGDTTKFFIANKAYFRYIASQLDDQGSFFAQQAAKNNVPPLAIKALKAFIMQAAR